MSRFAEQGCEHPAVRQAQQQPLLDEPCEALTYWPTADAERLGEFHLTQLGAGRVLAVKQLVPDLFGHLHRDGAAAYRGGAGAPAALPHRAALPHQASVAFFRFSSAP